MDANSAAGRSTVPPVSVLITDSALETLALYHRESDAHARRVETIVDSLKYARGEGRVVQLSGSQRPVWQFDVDRDHCVYVTMGQGSGCVEARIAFFGPPLPENTQSYKELLVLSGEAPYYALPEHIEIRDARAGVRCPLLPERMVGALPNLDQYVDPTEQQLLEALEEVDRPMDDLHGRPFRLLKEIGSPAELPARLSPQQKRMLTMPRPMFLQGVAGSGKTTLLTHFAHQELVRSRDSATILIVAYTDALKHFVEQLLHSLHAVEPVDLARVQVCTWRELCDRLAESGELIPFAWAAESQFENFARGLLPPRASSEGPIDLIPELKEFVRATLKGDTLDPDRYLIERSAFLAMPALAIDRYIDRKKVYDVALQYQHWLRNRELYDDIDAARLLLRHSRKFAKYDYVLVDETQDYTLAQLRLMTALAARPESLFYTGDMNQVVYPSQFNWKKVRSAVYHVWKQEPPAVQDLDYNYRNPQPVSRIANTLMAMRARRLELPPPTEALSNQATTPTPIRIHIGREASEQIIRKLGAQVGSLGVIAQKERHFEIEGIEFQRTFTPQTVKGLEFNVVCLVNFNTLYRDLAVKGKRKLTPRQLLLKFSEVYVSTTRARGQLLLIDEDAEAQGLWDCPELRDFANEIDDPKEVIALVTARYKLVSRDEWRLSALDFEGQQSYAVAGECWERAGASDKAARAYEKAGLLAKAQSLFKAVGEWAEAARISEELADFVEAARLYTQSAQWRRAAGCWVRAGNHVNAADAYTKIAEASGASRDWADAAVHHAKAKNLEGAAKAYEHAQLWNEAGQCWTQKGSLLEAARCYDLAGKQKQAREAEARHYEGQKQYARAAELWSGLRNLPKAAECHERAGNLDAAEKLYRGMGNVLESARLLVSMKRYAAAARDFQKLGRHDTAAEYFEEAREWKDAAAEWTALGATNQAIACYEKAGDWRSVGNLRSLEGKYRKAAEAYERCGDIKLSAQAWADAGEIATAATLLERNGEYAEAARIWVRAGSSDRALVCYVRARQQMEQQLVAKPESPAEPFLSQTVASRDEWPYKIAFTKENRDFVALVESAQKLAIPSLLIVCGTILDQLCSSESTAGTVEARLLLRKGIEDIIGTVSLEDMQKYPAELAELYEFSDRFDLAAPLWRSAGDVARAAKAYLRLGQAETAREICLALEDREAAAAHLDHADFHADAALLWIDLELYTSVSAALDLCGQNRLATIAKAIGFEHNGDMYEAEMTWEAVGGRISKEKLRAEVAKIVQTEVRARMRLSQPRGALRLEDESIFKAVVRFFRRLFGMEARA